MTTKKKIFCIKCKDFTDNQPGSLFFIETKNGKVRTRSQCLVCKTFKSRFLSPKVFGQFGSGTKDVGIVNRFIQALPFEAHARDFIFTKKFPFVKIVKYSFCGPGTKLEKRLIFNPGVIPKDTSKEELVKTLQRTITPGVNTLDETGCKFHDIAYKFFKDTKNRNVADRDLAEVADQVIRRKIGNKSERTNARIVRKIMQIKVKRGIGRKQELTKDDVLKKLFG